MTRRCRVLRGLADEQVLGQVELRVLGEGLEHAGPGGVPLRVLHEPVQPGADVLAELLGVADAEVLVQGLGQFRRAGRLDLLDGEHGLDLGPAQALGADLLGQRDVHAPGVADLGPGHLLAEVLGHPVGQGQPLLDLERDLVDRVQFLVAVLDDRVHGDRVEQGDGGGLAVLGHERAVGFEEAGALLGDLGVAELVDRLLDLQVLVARQVELGPHLDAELVHHRAVLGDQHAARVEFRRAERGQGRVLGELLQAGHQELRLGLAVDFLLELALDDLAGGLAGAEAGDLRRVLEHQVGELLLDQGVDGDPLDGHLDVLAARAGVGDFDLLGQLLHLRHGDTRVGVEVRLGGRFIGHDASQLGVRRRNGGGKRGKPRSDPRANAGASRLSCRTKHSEKAGDGTRTHDNLVGNEVLYH